MEQGVLSRKKQKVFNRGIPMLTITSFNANYNSRIHYAKQKMCIGVFDIHILYLSPMCCLDTSYCVLAHN